MKYDQLEALNRFEGLLGLFKRLHDKVKEPIYTLGHLDALMQEGQLLVQAFDEEINTYLQHCGNQNMFKPTINMILGIQSISACVGMHLHVARTHLHGVLKDSDGIANNADEPHWN